MKPIIYLDLDETLFATIIRIKPDSNNRAWIKLDEYWYGSIERPIAKELITFCRNLAPTKVLTNSLRAYAEYFCKEFGFGFASNEIISRNDYVPKVSIDPSGYGNGYRATTIMEPILGESLAIMVDNLYPIDGGAVDKMQYLGINSDRWVHIRDFTGKDPTGLTFEQEFDMVKERIKELVNECA